MNSTCYIFGLGFSPILLEYQILVLLLVVFHLGWHQKILWILFASFLVSTTSSTKQMFEGAIIERIVQEICIRGKRWQLVFGRNVCHYRWFAFGPLDRMVLPPLDWKLASYWSIVIPPIVDQSCILTHGRYEGGPTCTFTCGLVHTSWSLQIKLMLMYQPSSMLIFYIGRVSFQMPQSHNVFWSCTQTLQGLIEVVKWRSTKNMVFPI